MRRIITTLLTCALATVGLVALAPAAAQADAAPASVSATDGVRWADCRYYTYSYDIGNTPTSSSRWDATATLYDPTGETSDSDYLYDGANARAGTGTFFVCGGEPAGTWRITISVNHYGYDYEPLGNTSASTQWHLRAPQTRTSLRFSDRTPHYRQIIRIRVQSAVEKPNGYFANDYETVILQALRHGSWVKIKGSKMTTNGSGVATSSARWLRHAPLRIRAVTVGTGDFTASYSRTVRVG